MNIISSSQTADRRLPPEILHRIKSTDSLKILRVVYSTKLTEGQKDNTTADLWATSYRTYRFTERQANYQKDQADWSLWVVGADSRRNPLSIKKYLPPSSQLLLSPPPPWARFQQSSQAQ